ncbi:hypothetical protein D3C80_2129030 [compost metagenome]
MCEPIEAALRQMRAALFEGIPDEDIAATLRVFGALEAKLGRSAAGMQSLQQEGRGQ